MDFVGPLINLLVEVGKIVNFENSHALADRVLRLRDEYHAEIAKGSGRDDALIYSIRLELFNISDLYSTNLKGQAVKN
jgi:hypothetical protein